MSSWRLTVTSAKFTIFRQLHVAILHVLDGVCITEVSLQHVGMEMARLICGGCRTLLMHAWGATSVRCSCCHTVNLVPGTDI